MEDLPTVVSEEPASYFTTTCKGQIAEAAASPLSLSSWNTIMVHQSCQDLQEESQYCYQEDLQLMEKLGNQLSQQHQKGCPVQVRWKHHKHMQVYL